MNQKKIKQTFQNVYSLRDTQRQRVRAEEMLDSFLERKIEKNANFMKNVQINLFVN